jgi:DNA-binding transcriptional MerR regulator/methylmalonyl-CoA mutase cobalamin-binding subunit
MPSSDDARDAGRVTPIATAHDRGLSRIRAVAMATGIAADTLRVWERRYGNLASRRSQAGYRLYTEADVRRLMHIRALIDAGYSIGDIATLEEEELQRLSARVAQPKVSNPEGYSPRPAQERFLAAIDALDTADAERAIAAARLVMPPLELMRDLVIPLLHEVGDRWGREEITIAQEHAASAVLRGHLGDVLRTLEAPLGAPTVVAATPEGEQHEFGALMAGIVAGTQGFRVVYLGASVPSADLARAALDARASAALLSCVAMLPEPALRAVSELRRALPRAIGLIVGGLGAQAAVPEGVRAVATLEELPPALAPLRA